MHYQHLFIFYKVCQQTKTRHDFIYSLFLLASMFLTFHFICSSFIFIFSDSQKIFCLLLFQRFSSFIPFLKCNLFFSFSVLYSHVQNKNQIILPQTQKCVQNILNFQIDFICVSFFVFNIRFFSKRSIK